MKTTTIDGKEYLLKEDVDKEYCLKSEMKIDPNDFTNPRIPLVDEANVLGVGSVELGGNYQAVRVNIELLKKAIAIVEKVTYKTEKNAKRDKIALCICKDKPLCVGDITGRLFSGAILSPIVEK